MMKCSGREKRCRHLNCEGKFDEDSDCVNQRQSSKPICDLSEFFNVPSSPLQPHRLVDKPTHSLLVSTSPDYLKQSYFYDVTAPKAQLLWAQLFFRAQTLHRPGSMVSGLCLSAYKHRFSLSNITRCGRGRTIVIVLISNVKAMFVNLIMIYFKL